jgi:hypothetical protein
VSDDEGLPRYPGEDYEIEESPDTAAVDGGETAVELCVAHLVETMKSETNDFPTFLENLDFLMFVIGEENPADTADVLSTIVDWIEVKHSFIIHRFLHHIVDCSPVPSSTSRAAPLVQVTHVIVYISGESCLKPP